MKAKVKLDSSKLKEAVVKHFEKVLFAVVGLCFVWLAYSAMNVERFTGTPEELQQVSSQTQQFLNDQKFDGDAKDGALQGGNVVFRDAELIDPNAAGADWKVFKPGDAPTARRKSPKIFGP